jgi:tetraacyldisaccharide 4'-kinase
MTVLLESYITDHIEGRRKSPLVCGVLRAISTLFKFGIKLRNFAFDHFIKETVADLPVISVGNIIAGGTGKTALIQKLGKDLGAKHRIAVLLRGYRSEVEKVGGSLHLIEKSRVTPSLCGDEAYLLWKQLPETTFFIGKDRVLNAKRAAYHQADLALLDDGMQYRRLHRNFEIVMLHAGDLYGKGFYLPRGYLRDSPKRLAKADYVFINHVQDLLHFQALEKEVKKETSASIIGVQMVPHSVQGLHGENWENLKGRRVAVFCGLGKPDSFFQTVEKMEAEISTKLILPDHIPPTRRQLVEFAILAEEKGCELILCSEKDWVKLSNLPQLPLPIGYLKASLEVVANQGHYEKLLVDIEDLITRRKSETVD